MGEERIGSASRDKWRIYCGFKAAIHCYRTKVPRFILNVDERGISFCQMVGHHLASKMVLVTKTKIS